MNLEDKVSGAKIDRENSDKKIKPITYVLYTPLILSGAYLLGLAVKDAYHETSNAIQNLF